jgi:hypothetical protein
LSTKVVTTAGALLVGFHSNTYIPYLICSVRVVSLRLALVRPFQRTDNLFSFIQAENWDLVAICE